METEPEQAEPAAAAVRYELEGGAEQADLRLVGRLDNRTVATIWREVRGRVAAIGPARLRVHAGAIEYLDGAGAGLLVDLARNQRAAGRTFELAGATQELRRLWDHFDLERVEITTERAASPPLLALVGERVLNIRVAVADGVAFFGELLIGGTRTFARPETFRWRDALVVAEKVGANALPLILLIGFLLGLILSFESANLMKRYGAEIYVADLVGVSVLRELGPLITAIVLAGRSGSAFAAELGTMKINEELNALTTMGLDPMRFLVLPRVAAGITMMPLLTVFLSLAAVSASMLVLALIGIHPVTFMAQLRGAVDISDLCGGLFKACVLGMLVIGVGCLRGLQTKSGATAVGDATTSAVVTGIVLVAVADGIFSVIYYHLGI